MANGSCLHIRTFFLTFRSTGHSCWWPWHFYWGFHSQAVSTEPVSGYQDVHLLSDGHHSPGIGISLLLPPSRLQWSYQVSDWRSVKYAGFCTIFIIQSQVKLNKQCFLEGRWKIYNFSGVHRVDVFSISLPFPLYQHLLSPQCCYLSSRFSNCIQKDICAF